MPRLTRNEVKNRRRDEQGEEEEEAVAKNTQGSKKQKVFPPTDTAESKDAADPTESDPTEKPEATGSDPKPGPSGTGSLGDPDKQWTVIFGQQNIKVSDFTEQGKELLYIDQCSNKLFTSEDLAQKDLINDVVCLFAATRLSDHSEVITSKLQGMGFMAILKRVLDDYKKDDENSLYLTKAVLNLTWNMTDESTSFCQEIYAAGLHQKLSALLERGAGYGSHKDTFDPCNDITFQVINILWNLVRKAGIHDDFKESEVSSRLHSFLDHYKASTIIMEPLIVMTAPESGEKETTLDRLQFFVDLLHQALGKQDHVSVVDANYTLEYSAEEILTALRFLLTSEVNRARLVEVGFMPHCVELMAESSSVAEQAVTVVLLQQLLTCDASKQAVLNEPGCLDGLQRLAKSENAKVRDTATAALEVAGK